MKMLIGLSGGVDSSVTALLLKEQGHEVIGATMSIWGKDSEQGHENACYGPDEKKNIASACKLAEELGIPYHVLDCVEEYENIVLKNFKEEYEQGHTPNPCIWCNAFVKFGALPNAARKKGIEFDKFVTGHYARVVEEDGKFLLKRGIAPNKDQSYFLYRLTPEQLSYIMFPLGGYTKEEIRAIARKHGLEVADKPDSQDFYGGDYNELLGLEEREGNIVDTDGKILGKHKGIWNYTIGQRKGIGVSASEALYVLELRNETNEVVVGFADKTFKKSLIATKLNFLVPIEKNKELKLQAKFRSTQQPVNATIKLLDDDRLEIIFDDLQKSIAIGQSAVVYDNDTVVGGGIITEVH